MTPARQAVITDRYSGYLGKWSRLADEDGIVRSTYRELASKTGVQMQSVGPALRRMEALGLITGLQTHTVSGTRFEIAAEVAA